MKEILILSFVVLLLASCSQKLKNNDGIVIKQNKCEGAYKVGNINKSALKLKGIVINDDLKTISSPMAGIIDTLNCDAGKEVYSSTLIAKITPDFNNPNIINLSIQKGSLVNQKTNLESIKTSIIFSFDNQSSDLKEQIKITKKNIELTKKSSNLNKNDLGKQITSLENTLISLKTNLILSEQSKLEALEKIDISESTLLNSISSVSSDNLLKIDEVFGITSANKSLNDNYENYLSAKNTFLLSKLESEFRKLNSVFDNIDNLSNIQISNFLGDIFLLDEIVRNAVKNSIPNTTLTQTQIDALYLIFLTYGNNLSDVKNSWDSLVNSKSSTITTFDTQILSLQNQIDTINTSLDNLKTNKLDSVDVGLDLQLLTFDSALKTLNSSLVNLISTKESQVLSLDNQILQVEQSIDSLNTNLSTRNIYANVSGTVKQKISSTGNSVGINSPLCQVSPNTKSTKIKIYSPIELNMGDKLIFEFNNIFYEIRIENVLVYKDKITQNYVYESNYLDQNYFKDGEILSLTFDNEVDNDLSIKNIEEINKIITVPVSYVKNKIDGNFIKINSFSGVTEIKIELGDINGNFIEIEKGLEGVNEICK